MSHTHEEHASHGHAERSYKHTAVWLIVTVIIVCIAVPLLVLGLTLPKLP